MSQKITGIRSVDFMITASGEGVVNHNGSAKVWNPAAEQAVNNHLFPKLRGLDPMRKINADGKIQGLSLADPDLANASLIVSANCIRSHVFKNASFGVSEVTRSNVGDALSSLHGLMRGYLVTERSANFARKSPLYLTDFECAKPGLRYNQGSKAGERSETSIFSFFATDKDLQYVGKGSISIEDLQFIPLENSLGRSCFSEVVSEAVATELAASVTQYLQDISGSSEPQAMFVRNAVRKGTFVKKGEAGLLLNDAALALLVEETLDLIRNLYIRQSKGHLRVDSVLVDYNEGQAFRVLSDPTVACPHKTMPFAQYYEDVAMTPGDFEAKMVALKQKLDEAARQSADRPARKSKKKGAEAANPESAATEAGEVSPAATDA